MAKRQLHQRRTPNPTRHALREIARSLQEAWKGTQYYHDAEARWLAVATIALDVAIQQVEVHADAGTPLTPSHATPAMRADEV